MQIWAIYIQPIGQSHVFPSPLANQKALRKYSVQLNNNSQTTALHANNVIADF